MYTNISLRMHSVSALLLLLLLLCFTRGRYDPSGDTKIRGAMFLKWLVFTDDFLGDEGAA